MSGRAAQRGGSGCAMLGTQQLAAQRGPYWPSSWPPHGSLGYRWRHACEAGEGRLPQRLVRARRCCCRGGGEQRLIRRRPGRLRQLPRRHGQVDGVAGRGLHAAQPAPPLRQRRAAQVPCRPVQDAVPAGEQSPPQFNRRAGLQLEAIESSCSGHIYAVTRTSSCIVWSLWDPHLTTASIS